MSRLTNSKSRAKSSEMFSIRDMFKKQNRTRRKASAVQTQKIEQESKDRDDPQDTGTSSSEPNNFAASGIEVIDVDRYEDHNGQCKADANDPTHRGFEQTEDPSISSKSKTYSSRRLSLKRKQVSDEGEGKGEKDKKDIKICSADAIYSLNDESGNSIPKNEKDFFWANDAEKDNIKDQPYYQQNFEAILRSVLQDTDVSILFSDEDHAVLNSYTSLSEQARQVYIRLFGRKFKWIPSSKIKYLEIAEDLTPYLSEVKNSCLLLNEENLTESELRDVLETLSAGDLKTMAKSYHVPPTITQKKSIIGELIKLSQGSTISAMFGSKGGVSAAMLKKAKTLVRGVYKLPREARSVFIRVMMLFSLVNTTGDEEKGNGGQGQLFQMLMVNMGKVVYPSYKIEKKQNVFQSREDVIRFEKALQLESDLLHAVGKSDWGKAFTIYSSAVTELDKLQQDKEITEWDKNLSDFLRSFSASSVLYGLLSQGIEILQRRKEYTDAVTLIKQLLDQKLYRCTHRGYWWERLALNLDVHLKQPLQALEAVAAGLQDIHVIGGHRLALYQRAEGICERPKMKLKHRLTEFIHSPIRELPKVCLEGRVLHQSMTAMGPRFLTEGSYANGNAQDMTVCGVEEFVMEHYKNNGYPQGLHAEGSIITSLFGLLFWDILFMSVPDAFHSLYQAQPLDLYSGTAFYSARKQVIEERLITVENSSTDILTKMLEETWTNEHGKLCVGLNWDRLQSLEDVKSLVSCMGGKALRGILERYVKCPRHTRSGFPDLTLWNVETGAWKICEVKGPGDKLSHKQILWLDYLLSLGVDAEVCHVKAVAAKKLRPNT